MNVRRPIAAALLTAAVLSCSDSSRPSSPKLRDAALLAAQLDSIDRSIATPQLRSLSGLATPIKNAGIDVHNMSPAALGRTLEWSAIHREVIFTNRPGVPADAIRLILYTTDSTSRPAYPLVEIGYADLYPHNTFNGGGPDSMSLRFVVTDTRTAPTVVADFLAHSHADTACQCATVEGWASDGRTRVDFQVPYNIPVGQDGRFPGSFSTREMGFSHFATLPGPSNSTSTVTLTLAFAGDSISAMSGLLRPHAGRLDGESEILINRAHFATVTRAASGTTAQGPGAFHPLTNAEQRALSGLFAVPADIAYYIEWPAFVIFFCGC